MSKLKQRKREIMLDIGMITIKLLDVLEDLGLEHTCEIVRWKGIEGSEEKFNKITIVCTLPIYRWILVELKRLSKEFPDEGIWFVK